MNIFLDHQPLQMSLLDMYILLPSTFFQYKQSTLEALGEKTFDNLICDIIHMVPGVGFRHKGKGKTKFRLLCIIPSLCLYYLYVKYICKNITIASSPTNDNFHWWCKLCCSTYKISEISFLSMDHREKSSKIVQKQ